MTQVDAPYRLYEQPSKAFISSFVGKTNLLAGTWRRNGASSAVEMEASCWRPPPGRLPPGHRSRCPSAPEDSAPRCWCRPPRRTRRQPLLPGQPMALHHRYPDRDHDGLHAQSGHRAARGRLSRGARLVAGQPARHRGYRRSGLREVKMMTLALPYLFSPMAACRTRSSVLCRASTSAPSADCHSVVSGLRSLHWHPQYLHAVPLHRRRHGRVLSRDLLEDVADRCAATLICAVIGVPEAYILSRMRDPWRSVFLLVIIGPLLVSVVVRTFGWSMLLGSQGLVNQALQLLVSHR